MYEARVTNRSALVLPLSLFGLAAAGALAESLFGRGPAADGAALLVRGGVALCAVAALASSRFAQKRPNTPRPLGPA